MRTGSVVWRYSSNIPCDMRRPDFRRWYIAVKNALHNSLTVVFFSEGKSLRRSARVQVVSLRLVQLDRLLPPHPG
jgi:hypothetical protein